jgi:adenylate cyclase
MSNIQGLVACSDLTGYARFSARKSQEEIFHLLSDYYELVGDVILPAAGKVIKFMGDAALMLFPEEAADTGVRALLDLQNRGDAFLASRGAASQHHIRIHFGPMCIGPLGTRTDKRTDVLGSTVNTLFLLKTTGFALTPEAFEKLGSETKRLFEKNVASGVYVPASDPRRG